MIYRSVSPVSEFRYRQQMMLYSFCLQISLKNNLAGTDILLEESYPWLSLFGQNLMDLTHKLILYASLALLGFSLAIPGLLEMFKSHPENSGLYPQTIDAKNQLRALNGMMTGIGFLSIWACFDLERSRILVLALGAVLFLVVIARIYSIVIDSFPGFISCFYVFIEFSLCLLFLLWPPYE